MTGTLAERRCQQEEVYAAERTIHSGPRFASVDEVQRFVDDLRNTWWWVKWVPNVRWVEVSFERRSDHSEATYSADARVGYVSLGSRTPTYRVVVHELAHILACARYGSQSHDPWFARVYYELTYLVRGCEAAQELAIAFDELKVDYDAPGIARDGRTVP